MAKDGNSIILLVNLSEPGEGADYEAVGEQRGLSQTTTRAAIDASHKLSDHMKNLYGRAESTMTLDSLFVPTDLGLRAIQRAQREKQVVLIRRQQDGIAVEQAEGIVSSINYAWPDNDVSTVSLEIALNGFPVLILRPDDVENLIGWYQADALALADGVDVATWADSSDAGNDLTAAVGDEPIFKDSILNGYPVVRFDPTADIQHLKTAAYAAAATQPVTMFFVWQVTAVEDPEKEQVLVTGLTAADSQTVKLRTDGRLEMTAGIGGDERLTYPQAAPFAGFLISSFIFNGAASEIRENRELIRRGDTGDQELDGLTIGADFAGTASGLFGDIAEIVVYQRLLTDGERAGIEVYLSHKYAIELG